VVIHLSDLISYHK